MTKNSWPSSKKEEGHSGFNTLEKLNKINQTAIKSLSLSLKVMKSNVELEDFFSVNLNPKFIQSVFFNSNRSYLELISKNSCNLYTLLLNERLKSDINTPGQVIINAKDKKSLKVDSYLVDTEKFVKHIYKTDCFKNSFLLNQISEKNIKETLSIYNIDELSNLNTCFEKHKEWTDDVLLGELCPIARDITDYKRNNIIHSNYQSQSLNTPSSIERSILYAKKYQSSFSTQKLKLISNLCKNLSSYQEFCKPYKSSDYWQKIFTSKAPLSQVIYRCKILLLKNKIDDTDLKNCQEIMNKNPSVCYHLMAKEFPSYTPHPSCHQLDEQLKITRLNANLNDCPGVTLNESIVTANRIIMHFKNETEDSTPLTCSTSGISNFIDLSFKFNNLSAWGVKLCYQDPFLKREICHPSFLSSHPTSLYSQEVVVAEILKKIKGASKSLKCSVINKSEYKPTLLKYRLGCYIAIDPNFCTSRYCKQKIFYNNVEVKGISIKGDSYFDYFPLSKNQTLNDIHSILIKVLDLKSEKIINFVQMSSYLDKYPNAIVHGMGCLEDLFPEAKRAQSFNQCSPLSFIISGYEQIDSKLYATTHLGIDNVHSPRRIYWNHIFSSLMNLQKLTPTDQWNLYGLRK